MAYSDKVLQHYENPSNVGKMDTTDSTVGTGLVGAPACGDVLRLQIKVEDGIITDAKFKTYGCLTSNAPVNTPTCIKKIKTELGWEPLHSFDEWLEKTVKWYKAYYEEDKKVLTKSDLESYISDAKEKNIKWAV